jgi:hypothetical protein
VVNQFAAIVLPKQARMESTPRREVHTDEQQAALKSNGSQQPSSDTPVRRQFEDFA